MDYTEILGALNKATLFDLHRLQSGIYQELLNPERIEAIKTQLKPGQQISYFDSKQNCLIDAIVIQPKKTRCLVQDIKDSKRWDIPFYYINLADVDTDIRPKSEQTGIPKAALKVGDKVGFKNKDYEDIYGEVIRLNQKTATIQVDMHNQWRVSYDLLFPVLDGEKSEQKGVQELLPGLK